MFRRYREIWYSLAAIAVVTALYFVAFQQKGALLAASSFVGHTIGVVGIVLMLMTETLYSIRKRMSGASWGSVAAWLRFHIFTGLVGPYMVMLHSAMSFRGLAGISMLLTAVVVASGIFGRYVFTTAPHAAALIPAAAVASSAAMPVTAAAFSSSGGLDVADGPPRRASRSGGARSTLAVWRSWHVPVTWALFATAFVHAGVALFYATLQR